MIPFEWLQPITFNGNNIVNVYVWNTFLATHTAKSYVNITTKGFFSFISLLFFIHFHIQHHIHHIRKAHLRITDHSERCGVCTALNTVINFIKMLHYSKWKGTCRESHAIIIIITIKLIPPHKSFLFWMWTAFCHIVTFRIPFLDLTCYDVSKCIFVIYCECFPSKRIYGRRTSRRGGVYTLRKQGRGEFGVWCYDIWGILLGLMFSSDDSEINETYK